MNRLRLGSIALKQRLITDENQNRYCGLKNNYLAGLVCSKSSYYHGNDNLIPTDVINEGHSQTKIS